MTMQFRELGKRPISETAPAGTESRQSPEYERLLEETGKLGSLQGAAAVDWDVVVASAAAVLDKQAKDIPAAVYLCVGLAHTKGMDGLAAGVRVLADLLACWWNDCFPPLKRLRARANMFVWWHERVAQWLSAAPAAIPAALRDELLASLDELDGLLGVCLPDLPPLRDLKERVQNIEAEGPEVAVDIPAREEAAKETSEEAAPKEDIPKDVATPPPAAPTQTTETPAPATPPSQPAAPSTPPTDTREALANVLSAARAYVALAFADGLPDTFVAWSALYAVLWGRIDKLPPAEGGMTALPAPPEEDLDSCRSLLASGRAAEAAAALARLLPACPFCLDAQRLLFQALTTCGRPLDAARVLEECRGLTGRLPGVAQLAFADGRPFADAETRQWLTEQPTTAKASPPSGASTADDAVQRARAAAAEGDLPGALDLLEEARRRDGSASVHAFPLRIEQTRLLLAGGHAQAAASLADELTATIRRHELETWQPATCLDALLVCHAVWSGLETPEARQRAAETAAAIVRLRPSRSPYL